MENKEDIIEPIKPKNSKHYIDNVKFMSLLVEYNNQKQSPKVIGEELGEMFLLLVENISYSRNFINYSEDWKNEMKSDALYNCCKYIDKFDCSKYNNPYGYFTMIAFNAFKMRIKKEKTLNFKDTKLRAEIFEEFLAEEGLYKRKSVDVEDEANIVFHEMDNIKLDIEKLFLENEENKEDVGIEGINVI